MLPEDDSGDSSQPDDEGSEDGETDDHSQEDYTLGEEQLERRTYVTRFISFFLSYFIDQFKCFHTFKLAKFDSFNLF